MWDCPLLIIPLLQETFLTPMTNYTAKRICSVASNHLLSFSIIRRDGFPKPNLYLV